MGHCDAKGWPVIGKYIGLLDDNDNEPIFSCEDELFNLLHKTRRFNHYMEGILIGYLNKEME